MLLLLVLLAANSAVEEADSAEQEEWSNIFLNMSANTTLSPKG